MTSGINNYKSAIGTTKDSTTQTTSTNNAAAASKTDAKLASASIAQDDFLNLLVHQLQNQDPLNPMENQEFAVQLATFSQLEQLVQINDKVGSTSAANGSASEMAAYLGNQVTFNDNLTRVSNGSGSNLLVDIPAGTQSLRIDLMDAEGTVVSSLSHDGALAAGKQILALENLDVPDGKYEAKVVAVGANGRFSNIDSKSTGSVSGFVMEPEPRLLVGSEEVAIADVGAVYKG